MRARADQGPVVAAIYIAAMFMTVLDTTIVNVALPTIGRAFHARPDAVGAVSVAYLVSLAVVIPASGWLGDRLGGRNVLLGAIALFSTASALCGLADSLPELVVFRIVQGVGGAVMTPVGLTMLFRIYPPAERVRVASVIAVFTLLGPALGPILGGLFTTEVSWRLVFWVNLPVGLLALLAGSLWLHEHRPTPPGRLDIRGLLLSAVGLGAAMYGVSEGPVRGWSDPWVLTALGVGLVLLGALITVELSLDQPLLELRTLRNRMFATATGLYAVGSVAYLGALYLVALFLQDALRLSAVQAGLATFPAAVGSMLSAQIITRGLYRRVGPRRLTGGGLVLVAVALALMATVGTTTSLWLIRLIMLSLGLGIAAVFIPAQTASMATIGPEQTSHASAIFNAGKQLGGALGVALLTSVIAAGPTHLTPAGPSPSLTAFHLGFLTAAAVALATLAVAAAVRDADAASTRRPRPVPSPSSTRPTPAQSAARPEAASAPLLD